MISQSQKNKNIKILSGVVVRNKMLKTIVVSVEIRVQHPIYGKFIRCTIRLLVHDENKLAKLGDHVLITPCRPYSRRKSWLLMEVLAAAQ